MLKKVRVVVFGVLMASLLCYVCIGINAVPVLAGEGCQKSAATGCPSAKGGLDPCKIMKELGLTPEQHTQVEKLKAECKKTGQTCSPECFQKIKGILNEEQSVKFSAIVAKMKGGCAAPPAK
jgi:hypothetical protein